MNDDKRAFLAEKIHKKILYHFSLSYILSFVSMILITIFPSIWFIAFLNGIYVGFLIGYAHAVEKFLPLIDDEDD